MELLEAARKSLNTSRGATNAIGAQSHALDSIAASLLYIAENLKTKTSDEHIELVVRRLLDDSYKPNPKKASKK